MTKRRLSVLNVVLLIVVIILALVGLGVRLGLISFGIRISLLPFKVRYFSEDQALASLAVTQFHSNFNANRFQQIYDDADPIFRRDKREAVVAVMEKMEIQYGHFIKSQRVYTKETPNGVVVFHYDSDCEKDLVTEYFVWNAAGDRAVLIKYMVFSRKKAIGDKESKS